MTVMNDQRYLVREGVVARAVGDEMVLLDVNVGTYFTLNAVGCVIWQRLGAGDDVDAVVAAIVAAFEVEPGIALSDTIEFLRASMDAGLIATA